MPRSQYPGLGNLIQALSMRINNMQREIAEMRQAIRTLTHLVRQLQPADESEHGSERDRPEQHEE